MKYVILRTVYKFSDDFTITVWNDRSICENERVRMYDDIDTPSESDVQSELEAYRKQLKDNFDKSLMKSKLKSEITNITFVYEERDDL